MTTEKTECRICGKQAVQGRSFCSSGCALAAKIPLGDKALPVSLPLCLALISFFILFNQDLFATMHALGKSLDKASLLPKFQVASYVFGILWTANAIYFFAIAGIWRWSDRFVLAACVAVAFLPRIFLSIQWPYLYTFSIANTLMAIWLARGLLPLWRSRKNVKSD